MADKNITNYIKDFVSNNFYDKTAGVRTGIAGPIIGGALGLIFGESPLSGLLGVVLGTAAGPVIKYILHLLGLEDPKVPGGIPEVQNIPIGKAKPPLQQEKAPVKDGKGKTDNMSVESPILDNIPVLTANIKDTIEKRKKAVAEATELANLEAGGASTGKSAEILRQELAGRWGEIYAQEKNVADLAATMDRYSKERDAYMQKGGERDKLVSKLVERTGKSRGEIEALVPTLPEVPANARLVDNKAPVITSELEKYKAHFDNDSTAGKLPKELAGKKWEEIGTLSRLSYSYNVSNDHLADIKGDIHFGSLGGDRGGQRNKISDLPAPDFRVQVLGSGYMYPWLKSAQDAQDTYAANIVSLMSKNLDETHQMPSDEKAPHFGPNSIPLGVNNGKVGDQLEIFANLAIRNIEQNTPGDTEALAEYKKVLMYVQAWRERSYALHEIEKQNEPITNLAAFRDQLVKAKEQVDEFENKTLPDLNKQIAPNSSSDIPDDVKDKAKQEKDHGNKMIFHDTKPDTVTPGLHGGTHLHPHKPDDKKRAQANRTHDHH